MTSPFTSPMMGHMAGARAGKVPGRRVSAIPARRAGRGLPGTRDLPHARGLAYLTLLFLILLLGTGLAAAGVVWELRARREKEADLLSIGNQFRKAIDSYYTSSPAAAKQYPQRFEELIEDNRFPKPQRHLRRVYRDPFTLKTEWGQIIVNGRLVGVYSLAGGKPVRQAGFLGPNTAFTGATTYADWRFVALNMEGSPPPALNSTTAAPAANVPGMPGANNASNPANALSPSALPNALGPSGASNVPNAGNLQNPGNMPYTPNLPNTARPPGPAGRR